MAKILCIETASKNCSVALAIDGSSKNCVEKYSSDGYIHDTDLHPFIQELLHTENCKPTDLDAIAVSSGPGSYTGLRIGVSAAKGFAYSLEVPLIEVDTFAHFAQAQPIGFDYYIPVIDARRTEVYYAVFDSKYQPIESSNFLLLEGQSFAKYTQNGEVLFFGDGVDKVQNITLNKAEYRMEYPSATSMAALAESHWREGRFVDTAYFEPNYLKEYKAGVTKRKGISH